MTARHWTEEELIAHLYGVGPDEGHLDGCTECAARLNRMQRERRAHEAQHNPQDEVSFEFLAAQRRQIYNRLSRPASSLLRRLAPAIAASLVLAGGLLFIQTQHQQEGPVQVKASDTQLVEDVGWMATNSEPAPTAPLRALFED
jgi:anti-sigma factor RsiW